MAKNSDDKKTALKLVNKYAESYNVLEEENKLLRSELKDLKANLKINKEIIEGFFNSSSKKDQNLMYITKLKEENARISEQLEKTLSERDEIRSKMNYLEQTTSETINREKEENEKSKNKLFIMDNALLKKDNIILGLRKKLERLNEDDKYSQYYEKEIIVIEPSCAVTQIHDELLLYKQVYENLALHIRENRDSIGRYETIVQDLQNENGKLRTQIKLQLLSANRDNKHKEESKYQRSTSTETDIQSRRQGVAKCNGKNIKLPVSISKLKDKLRLDEDIVADIENDQIDKYNRQKELSENEEWNEIMKFSGLTSEEMDRLSKNKMLTRVIEAIEMLNRLLCDKNMQIRVLQKENDNLNKKNFELNKENISLFQQLLDLKNQLQKMVKESKTKNFHETSDSSMINNTSRITFNTIKINSVNQIQNSDAVNKESSMVQDNYRTEKLKQDLLKNYKDVLFNKFDNHNSNAPSHRSDADDVNNTIEYKKIFNKENSNNTIEEVNKNDSIIYTKGVTTTGEPEANLQNMNSSSNNTNKLQEKESLGKKLSTVTKAYQAKHKETRDMKLGTLDSCTLSEFKSGLVAYEGSFISQGNDDIENLNIEIKNSSG